MRQRVLGTLTIGQAPRPDVVPIIDRYVSAEVRRIHRGVLDGLSHAEIAARYQPQGGEPELVTRLQDGRRSKHSGFSKPRAATRSFFSAPAPLTVSSAKRRGSSSPTTSSRQWSRV